MGKFFSIKILISLVFLFIINGCQVSQNHNISNTSQVSSELSQKILGEIYNQGETLNLCKGDLDQDLSLNSSSVYPLNEQEYLIEILCFFGAYQGNYQYFLYTIKNSQSNIKSLYFQEFRKDTKASTKIENTSSLGGIPDYNRDSKILTIYSKGRGLADCGSLAQYQWKNSQFQLLEYRMKEECDGNYILPEHYPQIYP